MPAPRSGTVLRGLAILWIGLLAGFAIGIEWIRGHPDAPPPSGGIDLVGAGATFPYPLYRRWFADYGASSGVRINYFSVGSSEGIRLLLADSVDFGATDRPLSPDERSRARCGAIEIPMVIGAVAVTYNVPGLSAPLRLDADVIAAIFLGRITSWNAPPLRALNPGVALPALTILPVHRARRTGTSTVFEKYLASAPAWRAARSAASGLTAAGSRVEGNEGVTAEVQVHAGAIGIVELTYATQSRLPVAMLKNAAGAFILPSTASTARAAEELLTPAASDTLTGVIGATTPDAYPVVALTRIVVDGALGDPQRTGHFIAFARWALTEGARSAADVAYAPLPEGVAAHQMRRLNALRNNTCAAPVTP